MLEAKQFPIYQNIQKERGQYFQKVHNDIDHLGIARDNLKPEDIVSKHFNRLSKVDNPDASRRYVIAEARLRMIKFAVQDINEQKHMTEAIHKIHDIEYLEKRDHINLAKQKNQGLVKEDQRILARAQN